MAAEMEVEIVAIDKEQPELPYDKLFMHTLPFPGEELVMNASAASEGREPLFEVRVIRRQFWAGSKARLFVRVLPPQGTP